MSDVFDEVAKDVPKAVQPSQYAKPGPYTTALAPEQESNFQQWVKTNKVPWRDSPTADYDMRGYWKAQQAGDPNAKQAANKHFPDTWKTPYHQSFSNESKYATPDAPHWEGDKLVPTAKSEGDVFDQVAKESTSKPAATIKSNPGGVKDWLDKVESDVRVGGTQTLPGRVLHAMGAPGVARGVPEGVVQQGPAAPIMGIINAAQGAAETPEHPVRGPLRVVGGALQTASPALAFAAPEAGEGAAAIAGRNAGKVGKSAAVLGASAEELPVVGGVIKAGKKLGGLKDVWFPEKPPPVFPGAPLPEAPAINVRQANALTRLPATGARPAAETGEALGAVRTETPITTTAAPSRAEMSKTLDTTLRKAVGGEPLKPNVPLREQGPIKAQPMSEPKGSAAIEAHRYDAEAKEMHVTPKSNPKVTYVYGDVSPDQAAGFDSGSKGQAWKALRDSGSPPVAKIVDGKRIPVKPPVALHNAEPDLVDLGKKSIKAIAERKSKAVAAD